jgi:hypothetical protein
MNKEIAGKIGLGWLALAFVIGLPGRLAFSAEAGKSSAPELRYEEPSHLTGSVFAREGGQDRLLFKFKRGATRSGSTLDVLRDYSYPDGALAAREHVVYEGDHLVLFELEERQIGAAGSATVVLDPANPAKGKIEFRYGKTAPGAGKPKPTVEPWREDTLVADMVGPFLAAHWDALMRGDKVKCRYIVVPRRETVGFQFVKESEANWQGREVIIVKMEASSLLIAALVNPLIFTIEKAPPHRVVQYVGRTTPKLQSGKQWKDLDAVNVFDWK